ncbi:PIG-X-domain-containing protein [Aspergillus egyptiacus]|nr:PIG-X-domain-containing protein [Aspergillus egyptiacus]
MRQRTTFIQKPHAPFSPTQTTLTADALTISSLDAAREDRLIFSFDELSSEIWHVLRHLHQLHIRWASPRQYEAVSPFASRIAPGLNVFFSPSINGDRGDNVGHKERRGGRDLESLCTLLKKVFGDGLGCESPEKSFITPPILSTRFASTAAYQFYEWVPSLDSLVTYIQQKLCSREDEECRRRAELVLSADSIDINYDSISHALTVSGYWSSAPEGQEGWTETIRKHAAGTDKVEVGLLGAEVGNDPEEIKMGGLLVVVGEDKELKPTLFSFPSRHHPLPEHARYSVSFAPPTGLHPTMTISMARSALTQPAARPDAGCALHAYLTLPSSVFGDKYQLSTTDPLFLKSHNLVALRAVSGETDLEAPDWSVSRWGSTWLLELATPPESDPKSTDDWNVTIPLHLRYLPPSESGYRSASIPWPIVFWACTAEDGTKMSMNPFDRVNLGWEGLFGPKTMFYQLNPASSNKESLLVEELEVPVLALNEKEGIFKSRVIELGTVAVIVLGFLWVLAKLGLVARSSGIRPQQRKATDKGGKSE